MQIHLCMTRGYQRLLGETLFFAATVGANLAISLLLGSIFYQMPSSADSIQNRCVLLFFAILFNGLSSTLEVGLRTTLCRGTILKFFLGPRIVCSAPDRGETGEICPLSPVLRGYLFHDL